MEILNELLNKQLEFQKSLESVSRKLDEQAQKKPIVHLDHQAIASQIKAGLPSSEQFEKVNEQIRRTISNIPDRIPVHTSGDILGFTSFKALWINWAIFFSLLVLVAAGITYSKNQEIEGLKQYRRNSEEFITWIQDKYPLVWKVWRQQ
ncbi:hypothetical protein [Dyadobacter sediminis]|uniref:Uncharacterized protein n=1 Tax=Dyadobacter sediminis TaxID=1493691 RepID=A0A5R9KGF8_9BACT|nr:hypothetical protein [Dyadobacter sediminis]TLU95164.1 hypothetical protein FEM55_07355 [Dyadobacter sediminis]